MNRDFYIRQLRDWKGSFELEGSIPQGLTKYSGSAPRRSPELTPARETASPSPATSGTDLPSTGRSLISPRCTPIRTSATTRRCSRRRPRDGLRSNRVCKAGGHGDTPSAPAQLDAGLDRLERLVSGAGPGTGSAATAGLGYRGRRLGTAGAASDGACRSNAGEAAERRYLGDDGPVTPGRQR